MQGFVMGALTGGISMGVNAALTGLGMAEGVLGTSMLSGAIGGGITSAMFGGDFGTGALFGGISAGIAWGIDKLIPSETNLLASKRPVVDTILYAFKAEVRAALMGGGNVSAWDILKFIIFGSIPGNRQGTGQDLESASAEYKRAVEAYEAARGTANEAEALQYFNLAFDNLIAAAGYDTKVYNHNTITWEGGTYIHVNRNPKVVLAVIKLGKELGATKIKITEGDRTEKEHIAIYKDKPKDKQVKYETTEHGSYKGYMAADVQFYKGGQLIDKETAFITAKTITEIGGIGIYSFNSIHVDIRERVNGQPKTWDWR